MIREPDGLKDKLSDFVNWEKTKRRERIFIAAFFYAVMAALVTLPAQALLPNWASAWWMPVVFLIAIAPLYAVRLRWRPRDSVLALSQADKTLGLDERAITAWEILQREETKPTEIAVLNQAAAGLTVANPKALFERKWTWHAYLLAPFFLAWAGMLWFDVALQDDGGGRLPAPRSIAQRLKEFSRELQEKSKGEGLRESLHLGQELEKVAQKRLEGKMGEESFRKELGAAAKKVEGIAGAAAETRFLSAAESQQNLKDLRTELEAARDSLNFFDPESEESTMGQQLFDRLTGLPQLRKQMEKGFPSLQRRSQKELKTFLDRLEKQTTGELDRRTLIDAQEFLEQLLKEGQGQTGEGQVRMAGPKEEGSRSRGEREATRSTLPGDEPGKKEGLSQTLSQPSVGAGTQLKGLLGEGKSAGVVLKGKPLPGKAEVSQEEVISSYRRQAEAELNTERVPEGLKETIKNYFLSLGIGEGKR